MINLFKYQVVTSEIAEHKSMFWLQITEINTFSSALYKFWQFFFLCISFPGPVSSILVNKYGSRPIMILGGCLSGAGLVAASFCNSVEGLYFCVGVVGGIIKYK